jgi:diacylglycerol kinase (ATP)
MRVTLIHNPSAGSGSPSGDELMMWLSDAGYEGTYQSSRVPDLAPALERPGDLVVTAGGDGTIARVMRELAGRGVPVAILPLGTANNIATSLGIHGGPSDLIPSLHAAPTLLMDVATALSPWGDARFVESAGLGLFASVLDDAERDGDVGPLDLLWGRGDRMRRMLAREAAPWRHIDADGTDLSGACFFVAAFNMPTIGPRVPLAPAADPGDGLLDVLVVRAEDRVALEEYLDALTDGAPIPFPLRTVKCRRVRLDWELDSGHLDDKVWPDAVTAARIRPADRNHVTLTISGTGVSVLVPHAV